MPGAVEWWCHHSSSLDPAARTAALWPRADGAVVAVVDGVGELGSAACAASLVLDEVGASAPGVGARSGSVAALLATLDLRLEADLDAGEVAAVVVAVGAHGIVGASCGDSSAWFVSRSHCEELTEHQHRQRRLGSGLAIPVPFSCPLAPGWLVLGTHGAIEPSTLDRLIERVSTSPTEHPSSAGARPTAARPLDRGAIALVRLA